MRASSGASPAAEQHVALARVPPASDLRTSRRELLAQAMSTSRCWLRSPTCVNAFTRAAKELSVYETASSGLMDGGRLNRRGPIATRASNSAWGLTPCAARRPARDASHLPPTSSNTLAISGRTACARPPWEAHGQSIVNQPQTPMTTVAICIAARRATSSSSVGSPSLATRTS